MPTRPEQGYERSLIHFEGDEGELTPVNLIKLQGTGHFPGDHSNSKRRTNSPCSPLAT
jgi:hypothetical protein